MVEIEMSKDITQHSPKIIGPFTVRQVVSLSIAGSYGIPLLFALPFDITINTVIALLCMFPAVLCGWVMPFGIPMEKYALLVAKYILFGKEKRVYVETEMVTTSRNEKIKRDWEPPVGGV